MKLSNNKKPEGFFQTFIDCLLQENGVETVTELPVLFSHAKKYTSRLKKYGIVSDKATKTFTRNGVKCTVSGSGRIDMLISSPSEDYTNIVEFKSNIKYTLIKTEDMKVNQLISYLVGYIIRTGTLPRQITLSFVSDIPTVRGNWDRHVLEKHMKQQLGQLCEFGKGLGIKCSGNILVLKNNTDELTMGALFGNSNNIYDEVA
jgi:hypothetical protein